MGMPLFLMQRDPIEGIRELALDVFENPSLADEWLHSHLSELDGQTPLECVREDTVHGAQRVKDILTKIEHGIFS